MRTDMQEVLRDCHRKGGVYKEKGRAPRSLDEFPQREGMRRHYNWWNSRKERGSHMAPLYRYIDKQVGRRWDDVYSEICRALTAQTGANHDVLHRVDMYVETRGLFVLDGEVLQHSAYGPPLPPGDLFAHPETNVLCRANEPRRRWRWPKHVDPNLRVLSSETELRCIAGIWYEVHVAPVVPPKTRRYVATDARGVKAEHVRVIKQSVCRDVVTGECFGNPSPDVLRPGQTYATSKRQLSHAELKKHGLLGG